MNVDKIVTGPILAIIGVAALTTIFARKNTAAVFDSLGRALGGSISAALGKGVDLK